MSIWNEAENISKNNKSRDVIGEAAGDRVVFRSRERLMRDSLAAAVLLGKSKAELVSAAGIGAYYTAVLTLACSRVGMRLSLFDNSGAWGIMVGEDFISYEELPSVLEGILSSPNPLEPPPPRGEMLIALSDGATYSEEAAILSARAFAEGIALFKSDKLMFLPHESTPEGLFGGILAPLINGATSVKCSDARNMLKCMKLTSPTKLFCGQIEARALLLKLLRIKKLKLREVNKAESESSLKLLTAPTLVAIRRLIRPKILYTLGGKLKSVTVLGELSPRRMRAFFSFGILAVSVRTEKGLCPALFHYGGDKKGVWHLPRGSRADVCRVKKGGIGKIIISSPALREGESLDCTYVPLEKHFDGEKTSLVTTLSGYILKDGGVFEVK